MAGMVGKARKRGADDASILKRVEAGETTTQIDNFH